MLVARLLAEDVDAFLENTAEETKPFGRNPDGMRRMEMPPVGVHHGGGDDFRCPGVLAKGKVNIVFENEALDFKGRDLPVGLDVPARHQAELAIHDQRVLEPDLGAPVDPFDSGSLIRGRPERLCPALPKPGKVQDAGSIPALIQEVTGPALTGADPEDFGAGGFHPARPWRIKLGLELVRDEQCAQARPPGVRKGS
ncbi:hypothetical protein [Bradyrhizobium sp.]|uniref:hypothetical protein n=1 Tax=Bradyrhizobium sp. TaxID=376 RepID=UPI003C76BFCB